MRIQQHPPPERIIFRLGEPCYTSSYNICRIFSNTTGAGAKVTCRCYTH